MIDGIMAGFFVGFFIGVAGGVIAHGKDIRRCLNEKGSYIGWKHIIYGSVDESPTDKEEAQC